MKLINSLKNATKKPQRTTRKAKYSYMYQKNKILEQNLKAQISFVKSIKNMLEIIVIFNKNCLEK